MADTSDALPALGPAADRARTGDGEAAAGRRRQAPRLYARLSDGTRNVTGSPGFTTVLVVGVAAWLVVGPFVHYSRAWELSATAGAPILALVLLAVLQHTQNRDDKAIQLKLNEVIRASENASDRLIGIEHSPEVELSRLLSSRRHGDARGPSTGGGAPAGEPSAADKPGRRQRRRYTRGDLGPEHSFVFRSPEGRLNVSAQNLALFTHLANAIDDDTWLYHLRRGDYARWFRDVIGDEALAREAARLESADASSAGDSRRLVIAAIAERYPIPA